MVELASRHQRFPADWTKREAMLKTPARDIRALPKLEGTAHVNMALVVKFMANYLFNPGQFPEIPKRGDPSDDEFLFNQGPSKGLGKIQFRDHNLAFGEVDTPNVAVFKEQIKTLKMFLLKTPPSSEQQKDIDFLLCLGEIFILIPYGQLILENAKIYGVSQDLVAQIFHKPSSTPEHMELCLAMIKRPEVNRERFGRIWEEVYALEGLYEMNP